MQTKTVHLNTVLHVYTTHHLFTKMREIIDDILEANPQIESILDVPAGSGALVHHIATKHGKKLRACDIDAKKWAYNKLKLDVADLGREIPYKSNQFDMTICLEGLKHVTDLATAMNEISRGYQKGWLGYSDHSQRFEHAEPGSLSFRRFHRQRLALDRS